MSSLSFGQPLVTELQRDSLGNDGDTHVGRIREIAGHGWIGSSVHKKEIDLMQIA